MANGCRDNDNDAVKSVMDSLERKIDTIRNQINDIYRDIHDRASLNKELTAELNGLVRSHETEARGLASYGYCGWPQPRRELLETEIAELKKETRLEQVGYWRNHTNLREKLRDLVKEYETLLRRRRLIEAHLSE